MYGFAGKLAEYFVNSKITPILIIVSLALGILSILTTPKEEEPQIIVPMIDIIFSYPGATPEEVEKRVIIPMEKKIWELKDIEYVYSYSTEDMGIITARFYVGTDPVKALVDLNSKLMSAYDQLPHGVSIPPLIKPKSIDDVPILTLTLWGENYDWYSLRKIASTLENEIKKINNVSEVFIVGGIPREIRILVDPKKLEYYKISPLYISHILKSENIQLLTKDINYQNYEYKLRVGNIFSSKTEIENIVLKFDNNNPVYLKDVVKVIDGPYEPTDYVFMGLGPAYYHKYNKNNKSLDNKEQNTTNIDNKLYPAVTIAVAKRKGTNAIDVSNEVIRTVEHFKSKYLAKNINIDITRNYGYTAQEKSNDLLKKLLIATLSVVFLISVFLGYKEGIIVAITIPVTLALALFISQMLGFTLNRVTLFALIFAIGILVDDSIVVVENIHRWISNRLAPNLKEAIVKATDEVGNPTILATFTVIAALMPMAFVTGLMGPYMKPIPINSFVAMFFFLFVAFIVTPWTSYLLFKKYFSKDHKESNTSIKEEHSYIRDTLFGRIYSYIMIFFLTSRFKRFLLYSFNIFLLLFVLGMFINKSVVMKMLPFDNKSEIQIVLDMPEGTTKETTLKVMKEIAEYIAKQSIVQSYQIYVGTSSPFNFNGLVRHYYLRNSSNMADMQIQLVDKKYRKETSHEFAKRIRPIIHQIAKKHNVKYIASSGGTSWTSCLITSSS